MPILRPCRTPYCAEYAQADGWCARHWRPKYAEGEHRMSPDWSTLRLEILRRDQWRCQLCRAPANHVDHIRPRSAGGTDHSSNLRALCAPCHHRETGRSFGLA
jgi:5-methylcytosine-specific restriction protein A